jgi:hypothetical protein
LKEIALTDGNVALVDDRDYEYLSQFTWFSMKGSTNILYAVRVTSRKLGVRRNILMHREVMCAMKGQEVDHRDHNGLNNCKGNLRFCSKAENQWNTGKQRNNTSGFKGVDWYAKYEKWRARISINRKVICLGYFESAQTASVAYRVAAEKYCGNFARTEVA